eukprot:1318098-Amphidinium_carterae.1
MSDWKINALLDAAPPAGASRWLWLARVCNPTPGFQRLQVQWIGRSTCTPSNTSSKRSNRSFNAS